MKTEQLVRALAADHATPIVSPARYFVLATAVAILVSTVIFMILLGPRDDVMAAIRTPRFQLKIVEMLLLAATSAAVVLRLMRPEAEAARLWSAIMVAPVLLALAVVMELSLVPSSGWASRLVGTNSLVCLASIPLLSVPLLAAAWLTLRHGAPARPRLAGAVAGLFAGGLAAAIYAAGCTDDSPLFVAVWYSIAIGIPVLVGAVVGPRLLRW
jgi:hypothetical protein